LQHLLVRAEEEFVAHLVRPCVCGHQAAAAMHLALQGRVVGLDELAGLGAALGLLAVKLATESRG
jgi:hypothetical protein